MSQANTGPSATRIERVEGLFIVRAPAAYLHVWSSGGGEGARHFMGAPLGAIRDRLRVECVPQALCVAAPAGMLVIDRGRDLHSDAAGLLVNAGGTLSVRGGRVAVGRGDAFADDADIAIQGAPLLVEDGKAVPQGRGVLGWRAAVVVFDSDTAGFAVGYHTLQDFAVRLANAGVLWSAHGAVGDGVRVMDGRGDFRGSPINKLCQRAWYVAPPRWESKVDVRDASGRWIS